MESLSSRLGWALRSSAWNDLIYQPGMESFRELNFPRIWQNGTREYPNSDIIRDAMRAQILDENHARTRG
jgi:hypothetical protein